MRSFITLALSAIMASTTAMAPAAVQSAEQNRVAPAQPATTQTAKPAKPAEPKICRRLQQEEVCMTEKRWREFDERM